MINRKLFEFDHETKQLRVKKSKLVKIDKPIELEHKIEVQNLEQKRKGRRLRNIGFLLTDFFKEIDVKGAIKNNYQLMNFALMLDKEPEVSKPWEFSQQQAKKVVIQFIYQPIYDKIYNSKFLYRPLKLTSLPLKALEDKKNSYLLTNRKNLLTKTLPLLLLKRNPPAFLKIYFS